MSKGLVKNNHIIKPFIISAIIFIFVGSFIGSIWFASILKVNIPLFDGSIFNLHRMFQVESGLTLLIMGIGFIIVPRFRNVPMGSPTIIKISFLSIIVSAFLSIVSAINMHEPTMNEKILFISELFRIFGILLFVGKIIDTLKVKPKLLRTADYFIGFSSICLLIVSILNVFKPNDNSLTDIEIQLLFPLIMIFGIEYKTLPSFLGFIRPRNKLGVLSLLFLIATFILGIATRLRINDDALLPILFNLFLIFSSITFSVSIYLYSNYENKKYILRSPTDKRERYLYTLYHTRISFCFLYLGAFLGILYHMFDKKFIFYDLSIHFTAIGFIGITIASYLPMMLAPILGKPIVLKKINRIPLIIITISLLIRTTGMAYMSYFDSNGFSLLHALTGISGFLIPMAIIIFITVIVQINQTKQVSMEKMGSFSRGHKDKWYLLRKCYTTATGSVVKEAVTAILMHSLNGNSTVVGVSNGGTDFNVLNKEPQSFSITDTTMTTATATAGDLKRVVYADSNGQKRGRF